MSKFRKTAQKLHVKHLELLYEFEIKQQEVEKEIEELKSQDTKTLEYMQFSKEPRQYRHIVMDRQLKKLLQDHADIEVTIRKLKRQILKTVVVTSQSMSEGVVDSEVKVDENVTDVLAASTAMQSLGHSAGPDIGQKNLLSLDDFFSRPVNLGVFEYALDSIVTIELDIWDLITLDPSIRSKLRNYTYLRADVGLRIIMSGTPFHFGKALVSYQPHPLANETLLAHLSNLTILGPTYRPLLLNYLSQAPGSCILDFNGNRTIDMLIPFISPKPMFRLYNPSAAVLSAATSYVDLEEAGTLYIQGINPVSACTTDATAVSLHVYAWLENVELGPPTATQIEITSESADERRTGPVERVSSSMAMVLGALERVPSIGFLAKASKMIMQGVSGIAAHYGWSRPQIMDETRFIKNRPYCSSSNTIGAVPVDKIAYDPLQEITVDPRVCGSDQDEMTYAFLNAVQTYLTTFEWEPSNSPLVDMLWVCKVSPFLSTYIHSMSLSRWIYAPTAMMFAAVPHEVWRGSIKFRIEIVCSKFHRGKIAFFYEPNSNQMAIINTSIEMNKNYMKVIDIQETQDIEFCVNYAAPNTWLYLPDMTDLRGMYGTAPAVIHGTNGYIGITPFTTLQSPDGSGIFINVYVSSDDMQYNVLSNSNMPTERLVILSESADEGVSPQVGYTCFELNATSEENKATSEYCYGEQPISFRSGIKRFVSTASLPSTLAATVHTAVHYVRGIILPARPAYGIVATTRPTLIEYLPYAYLGVKGGMRRRVAWYAVGENVQPMQNVNINLLYPATSHTDSGPTLDNAAARLEQMGGSQNCPNTQGGIEVELPFYSPNLFAFSCSDTLDGGYVDGQIDRTWVRSYRIDINSQIISAPVNLTIESAAAEDFTFMRFLGAPYFTLTT